MTTVFGDGTTGLRDGPARTARANQMVDVVVVETNGSKVLYGVDRV